MYSTNSRCLYNVITIIGGDAHRCEIIIIIIIYFVYRNVLHKYIYNAIIVIIYYNIFILSTTLAQWGELSTSVLLISMSI